MCPCLSIVSIAFERGRTNSTYKLYYFKIGSSAEPIQIALTSVGVHFDEVRHSFEECPTVKLMNGTDGQSASVGSSWLSNDSVSNAPSKICWQAREYIYPWDRMDIQLSIVSLMCVTHVAALRIFLNQVITI